jgi:dolichyl-diphosphooligosaccharide--protein glycosyltransferase
MVPTSSVKINPGQSGNYTYSDADGAITRMAIQRGTANNTTTAQMEFVRSDTGEVVKINDTVYNPYNASNLIVIEDGQLMKNESIKGAEDGNFTIFLIGNKNEYTPFVIHNELANSMFTRLYLMGGAGQDVFTNIHNEPGVMLFKVNFDKTGSSGNSTSENSTNV